MPEIREAWCSGLYLKHIFEANASSSWDLHDIWYDATDKEQPKAPKASRLRQGLVDRVPPWSLVRRGSKSAQTTIWPPTRHTSKKSSRTGSEMLHGLTLQEVIPTCRTVQLNLGDLCLQVQYLTHTSIQVYSRATWRNSICKNPKTLRTFRIGMALEFQDFVIAFISRDQVFQPQWARTIAKLPVQHIDILQDFIAFQQSVVDWMKSRRCQSGTKRKSSSVSLQLRTELLCHTLRSFRLIWGGVGVYVTSELMAAAGLPPSITEQEVFDNPSRCARLCEALYVYACTTHDEIWPNVVKPCIHDGIIAPTDRQREAYTRWLLVYGKDSSFVSSRLATLIDAFQAHVDAGTPEQAYDAFEPTNLQCGLSLDGHLGELIFGADIWQGHVASEGRDAHAASARESPLYKYYEEQGLLDQPTHLSPHAYQSIYLSDDELCAKRRYTFLYKVEKVVWSLLPISNPKDPRFEQHIGDDKKRQTFRYKIKHTRDVAVGPLEYCANGIRVRKLRGRGAITLSSQGDPNPDIPRFYVERGIRTRARKIHNPKGKHNTALDASTKREVKQIMQAAADLRQPSSPSKDAYPRTRPPLSASTLNTDASMVPAPVEPARPRKRRRNVDSLISSQGEVRLPSPVKRTRRSTGSCMQGHPVDSYLL